MKKVIVTAVVILLVTGSFFFLKIRNMGSSELNGISPTPSIILPTITDDTKVSLTSRSDKRTVILTIKGIPKNMKTIKYDMTYMTQAGLVRGINGTIKLSGERDIVRDDLILGSCSSGGRCTYDEGVKEVDLSLKFTSSIGASIFKKTISL